MLDRQSGNTTFSQNIPAVSSDIDKNNIEQTPLLKLAENDVIENVIENVVENVIQIPLLKLAENDVVENVIQTPLLKLAENVIQTPLVELTENVIQTPPVELTENVIQTPLVELTESVIQTPPVELTENDKMLTDDSNKENFIKKMEESTLEPIQEENDLELDEFISRIDLIDDNIKDKDTKSETQSTISSKKKKNPFNKVLNKLKKKTNIDESEN